MSLFSCLLSTAISASGSFSRGAFCHLSPWHGADNLPETDLEGSAHLCSSCCRCLLHLLPSLTGPGAPRPDESIFPPSSHPHNRSTPAVRPAVRPACVVPFTLLPHPWWGHTGGFHRPGTIGLTILLRCIKANHCRVSICPEYVIVSHWWGMYIDSVCTCLATTIRGPSEEQCRVYRVMTDHVGSNASVDIPPPCVNLVTGELG